VLCLIVTPLPPCKDPFAVKMNNNDNTNNKKKNEKKEIAVEFAVNWLYKITSY
jgi:hypothetical protein